MKKLFLIIGLLGISAKAEAAFKVSSGTVTGQLNFSMPTGSQTPLNLYEPSSGAFTATQTGGIAMSNSSFSPYGVIFSNLGLPLAFQNSATDGQYIATYFDATQHIFDVYDYDLTNTNHLFIAGRTAMKTGVPLYLYTSFNYGGLYTALHSTNTVGSFDIYLPPTDGTSGQALVTDGAGRLTFATITGAGAGPFTNAIATTSISMAGKNINSVGNLESTGTIHTTISITADGTIGSNTGSFNVTGTTVTSAAPAIDTTDRVPILNNGSITWPAAISASANVTWTGNHVFTASTTLKGTVYDGSASAGTSGQVYTSNGAGTVPTWQTSSAGSGPFTNAIATTNISMGGFYLTNMGPEGWPVDVSSHPYTTADWTIAAGTPTIPGLTCTLATSSTYTFTAYVFFKGNGSGAGSGVKYQVTLPTGATMVHWRAGGPSTAASATRMEQGSDAVATYNSTALSAYTSQSGNMHIFSGVFATGSTAGNFNLLVSNLSGGTPVIEQGSTLHVWHVAP
jgi:hypothetical protein